MSSKDNVLDLLTISFNFLDNCVVLFEYRILF